MVRVQSAAYTPTSTGGELRAHINIGEQDIVSNTVLDYSDQDLRPLVEQLLVKVQQVEFVATPGGGEIRTTMTVGERSFVSRVQIEEDDQDLHPLLERLLDEVGRQFVRTLRAALSEEEVRVP
ncbi:MAG: hypothetical protein NVS2B16_19610 [Chloroflexota bacterium]